MLELQKYLRSGKSLDNLKEDFGIKATPHIKYPNLYSFKYHQLDSPTGEKIVQESRGIILDSNNNWDIVAHPFNRFFNYGEGHAAEIDWKSAEVQEKADGSIIILYFYKNEWHVATSGNPAASGPVCKDYSGKWQIGEHTLPKPKSFAEYFWQVMNNKYFFPDNLPTDYCYMFELMGPLNRIIVKHDEPKLVTLGGRHVKYGQEIPAEYVWFYMPDIPLIKNYQLSNIDEILSTFKNMSPLSQEGYVVVDKYFNRIKIKSPAYIALHHAKDGFTLKRLVTIAITGESSEVISSFPEFAADLKDANERVDALVLEIENVYDKLKDIDSQKEFAIEATKYKFSGSLFKLRAGKIKSLREHLASFSINKLMSLLGY